MINIFSDNITWSIGTIIGLFGIIAGHRLLLYRDRKNNFSATSATFRNKILIALEGIYPITRSWWDESLFPKFPQSVSKIETAGAEFRHFVKRKTAFDAAIKDYRDYCQRRTYERGAPRMTYPNSPAPPNPATDPIEEFKNIVEHLLSFAEKK